MGTTQGAVSKRGPRPAEAFTWSEILRYMKANVQPTGWSLLLGLAGLLATVAPGLASVVFSESVLVRKLGLPISWLEVWKGPGSGFFR